MVLYTLVYLVQEYTQVSTMCRMGDIWSLLNLDAQQLGVFTEVDPQDFLTEPVPEVGDTLLTMAGLPATRESYFQVFNTRTPAGLEVPVEFTHGGAVNAGVVRTRSIPFLLGAQFILIYVLHVAITIGLLATGLLAFARKPGSVQVMLLTMFCFSLTSLMVLTQPFINPAYGAFTIPFQGVFGVVMAAFASLAPGFWLLLQMVFPRLRRRYLRHRNLAALAVLLPPALMSVLSLVTTSPVPPAVQVVLMTAFFAAGFILLGRSVSRAQSLLEKRQGRLVLWGSVPGISLFGLVAIANSLFPGWQAPLGIRIQLALSNMILLIMLLTPVCFLYAFGRYRLLEIEARMKRGTFFVLVNTLLVALFALFVYGLGWFLMRIIRTDSTIPVVAVSLGFALGIAPAQRRLRSVFEDRIFPERRRLRALLRDFLGGNRGVSSEEAFWEDLGAKLREGLGTGAVYPVLPGARDDSAPAAEQTPPFSLSDGFLKRLCEAGAPLHLDEMIASGRFDLTAKQWRWLLERKVSLLVPLSTHAGPLGFIAAASKTGGDDYTAAELDILASLSTQIAMASENINLMRERIEKEKLEQQLDIARGIQKGLLPRGIPETPGLEIASSMEFCLQVAGDFYDIQQLDGGRTLIAAGDVTGKGVGPALLMANLQASLRAMSTLSMTLAEEVARLNELLCESTPEDYFITLFIMVFDPSRGEIRWVNAGHNPPLLVSGGRCTRLETGGLLLGVQSGAAYSEGLVEFCEGDLLLVYTDGVSEAMNQQEEEFGEQRLAALLERLCESAPSEVMAAIERDVRAFHGSGTFEDDMTMVVIKRTRGASEGKGAE
jgi:serine phosphatase RsbU (regulator of sigma subunit)